MDPFPIIAAVVACVASCLFLVNGVFFFFLLPKQLQENNLKAKFRPIPNQYENIEQVQEALRTAGLRTSNLILGIDYSASNVYKGQLSFAGKSLHDVNEYPSQLNPYQQVISILGETLEPFDEDHMIPAYGFGDSTTTDRSVFSLFPDRSQVPFKEVLTRYSEITPKIQMAGPTNFAPMIREAIKICNVQRTYHILVIIADGEVTSKKETKAAIVEASNYPLSILLVGVGDGPWEMMKQFDNELPRRKFDNFQFVNFNDVLAHATRNFEPSFALHALMEIPAQYMLIRDLGLIGTPEKKV
eukprot:TRINITY_DN4581_c0_g1_i1.p1 TRINITY_DN4581_c0_g1~~TRINITY_DN4581_c0_g1_i1.p1  ORF type:complete len:300 (+),score=58.61 TRINITY_DN4581_c0_g1_i1:12-911(+)